MKIYNAAQLRPIDQRYVAESRPYCDNPSDSRGNAFLGSNGQAWYEAFESWQSPNSMEVMYLRISKSAEPHIE